MHARIDATDPPLPPNPIYTTLTVLVAEYFGFPHPEVACDSSLRLSSTLESTVTKISQRTVLGRDGHAAMAVDPRRTAALSTSPARPTPKNHPSTLTVQPAHGYTGIDVAKSVFDRLRGVRRPSSNAAPGDNPSNKANIPHRYG